MYMYHIPESRTQNHLNRTLTSPFFEPSTNNTAMSSNVNILVV